MFLSFQRTECGSDYEEIRKSNLISYYWKFLVMFILTNSNVDSKHLFEYKCTFKFFFLSLSCVWEVYKIYINYWLTECLAFYAVSTEVYPYNGEIHNLRVLFKSTICSSWKVHVPCHVQVHWVMTDILIIRFLSLVKQRNKGLILLSVVQIFT